MARKSTYSKDVYDQLEDIMARLSAMETSHKEGQKEIKHLNSIVCQQEREIEMLSDTVRIQAETIENLEQENACLKKENQLLRNENDRMKRSLNNNSTGSSGKPANQYNGRTVSQKKKGG